MTDFLKIEIKFKVKRNFLFCKEKDNCANLMEIYF